MSSKRQSRFEKVDTSYNFPAMEQSIQSFWEDQRIFQQSLEKDAPQGSFVFYEGPPTANSLPHPGHVLTRVIKDCLPRFRTMQGYYVRRQAGWDTHGNGFRDQPHLCAEADSACATLLRDLAAQVALRLRRLQPAD